MGLISSLRNLYDLDTLDTRFTNSSNVPYKAVIEARGDPAVSQDSAAKAQARAQPPKWKTPEFYLYYVVLAIAIPLIFWIPYQVSGRMLHVPSKKSRKWNSTACPPDGLIRILSLSFSLGPSLL